MRELRPSFVAARPSGARVRTRLHVDEADTHVLWQVGRHLGQLAGQDLARRTRDGLRSDRTVRKRALTGGSSSRWAGAITRTSNDQWARARANQQDTIFGLQQAVATITARAAVPCGETTGTGKTQVRGYRTGSERRAKLQRRDLLAARMERLAADHQAGRVSIVRGGRRLAHTRHHLEEAALTQAQWRDRWEAARLFMCADGEADKKLGNETIRWDPADGSLSIKLPAPLAHLANDPHGRYQLSCDVIFTHRGAELAAQTVDGAVRYDITFDTARGRWYLDASWSFAATATPARATLHTGRSLALDLNADHVAGWVIDPSGNPVGTPLTFTVPTTGSTAYRDAQTRHLVSQVLNIAKSRGCVSVTIEDLNFTAAVSRDSSKHPRGGRGRRLRRTVAGIPTAKFRDRLTQMAANIDLWIVVVDPAYTSQWARPRVKQLNVQTSDRHVVTGHQAAATMVGRRGYGHDLHRAERRPVAPPEDGDTAAPHSANRSRSRTTSGRHRPGTRQLVGVGPD